MIAEKNKKYIDFESIYPLKFVKWERGVDYTIFWRGGSDHKYIKIRLVPQNVKSDAKEYISKKTLNTGKYTFQLRRDLKFRDYKIVLEDLNSKPVLEFAGRVSIPLALAAEPREYNDPNMNIISAEIEGIVNGNVLELSTKYKILNKSEIDYHGLLIQIPQDSIYDTTQPSGLTAPNVYSINTNAFNIDLVPKTVTEVNIFRKIEFELHRFNSLRIDPMIQLNGQIYVKTLTTLRMKISLPETITKLLFSNNTLIKGQETYEDGTKVNTYSRSCKNCYLFPETIKWTTAGIDVNITKNISRRAGTTNKLDVKLEIKNNSDSDLNQILLYDSFSPADIEGVELERAFLKGQELEILPSNFEMKFGKTYGIRLYWQKEIETLTAGQTKLIEYTVREINDAWYFGATTALFENSVISISNTWNRPIDWPLLSLPQQIVKYDLGIVPMGWTFDYDDDDHHINDFYITTDLIDLVSPTITWKSKVNYSDKNHDDDYRWSESFCVFKITNGKIINEELNGFNNRGSGSTLLSKNYADLKNFENVVVTLRGTYFNLASDDHHSDIMGLVMTDQSYDKNTGHLTANVYSFYEDKNSDERYDWGFQFTTIGFNNGKYQYGRYSGSGQGRNILHSGNITDDSFKGYDSVMVLPTGWKFNFRENDHHLNEIGFKITNVSYNKSSGRISWNTWLTYADKNFDDDFYWEYGVVVIVLNNTKATALDYGIYSDGGGWDEKTYQVNSDAIFYPTTWTDGIKNGTETGIDCGGLSPSECLNCIQSSVNFGNAASSSLFSLNDGLVLTSAIRAKLEYASEKGIDPSAVDQFYSGDMHADRLVEAVARFLAVHMEYISDDESGQWDGAQSARKTLHDSGSRANCTNEFSGDCEDHAILRTALLRVLRFNWKGIFCADHHSDIDQQQDDCPQTDDKKGGHTYNIVYYKGKYRILDYGYMIIRYYSACWGANATDNLWNDHYAHWWGVWNLRPFNGKLLHNYPGQCLCPTSNWNWRTFYGDICP